MRILPLTLALMVAAGAAQAQSRVPVPTAEQTEFVGWMKLSNGEFQLYFDQDDVRRPLAGRVCISGAADNGEMHQARDLAGQKVRIAGRTAPWTDAVNGRIEQGRSNIRNDCAGAFVILADDIRPSN